MRKRIRPYLFWILLAFLAIGLVYPAVGIIALTCMIAPVAVAPFRGRYWCGNYCPRGSFYDHVLVKLSPQRKIPAFFQSCFITCYAYESYNFKIFMLQHFL